MATARPLGDVLLGSVELFCARDRRRTLTAVLRRLPGSRHVPSRVRGFVDFFVDATAR